MRTTIKLNDCDFRNLLTFRRMTIQLKESVSFAKTTAGKGETISLRHKEKSIEAVVTERKDIVLNNQVKGILLQIKLV